jgi:hypothetical protein
MYAFIHIPKTGGSTVRALLRHSFGASHCDLRAPMHKRKSHEWIAAKDFKKALRVYRQPAGICGHRVAAFNQLETVVPDLRYFTLLRDPVKRCVSRFLHLHRSHVDQCTPDDLKRFCVDPLERNVQTRWLCGSEDAASAISIMDQKLGFVGLTERFDETMVMFHAWLGSADLKVGYKTINVGKAKPSWPILEDPELAEVVREANQADFELHRHAAEHTFAKQVNNYGAGLEADVVRLRENCQHVTKQKEPVWGRLKRNCVYKPLIHLRVV